MLTVKNDSNNTMWAFITLVVIVLATITANYLH